MSVSLFALVAELKFITGCVPLKSDPVRYITGFDNCRNDGYSDMLGARSFNILCKGVLPLNRSNKIKNRKIGVR